MSPRRLQVGLSRVNQYAPILRGDYRPIELDYLYNQLGEQIEGRMEQAADKPLTRRTAQLFKHAGQLTTSLNDFIANPDNFHTPWPNLVPTDPQTNALRDQTVYLLSDRGTMGYLPRRAENGRQKKPRPPRRAIRGHQYRSRRGVSRFPDRPDRHSDSRTRGAAAVSSTCCWRSAWRPSAAWW